VGEELACPLRLSGAKPFPGPGLGVRIRGEVTRERAEILRNADFVVVDEIKKAGLYRELWQSFAVLPVVRTVGVMEMDEPTPINHHPRGHERRRHDRRLGPSAL